MKKDYYEILGVPRNSSKEDIKRAYYILAQQYHPDKSNGSEKRFKEINEAYRILFYDNSREQHDEELKNRETRNPHDFKEVNKNEEQTKNSSSFQEVDVEKLKNEIRVTGNLAHWLGLLTIALNIGIYVWNLLDKNFSESGLPASDFLSVFLMVAVASTFVVLGGRIKQLIDVKIKDYLEKLVVVSGVLFVWAVLTGGKVGILFFILFVGLVSSLVKINKLMKVKEFVSKLTNSRYSSLWDFVGDADTKKEGGRKAESKSVANDEGLSGLEKWSVAAFLLVVGLLISNIPRASARGSLIGKFENPWFSR